MIFRERGERGREIGRERERERESNVGEKHQSVASHITPQPGNKPTIGVCTLTEDQTCNLLVYRMILQPLRQLVRAVPMNF